MSDFAADYERDGACIVPGVFSGEVLAELTREFDRIVDRLLDSGEDINAAWKHAEPGTVVLHTHNVQQYSAAWTRALLHAPFLDAIEALIGPDIILHHSKLFQKPPEKGASFPMHQDWPYFPFRKDSMMAAVIHISDATDEMGCLRVYPGSNQLGRLSGSDGNDEAMIEKFPLEQGTPIPAKAGDVVVFNYLTVHGSLPNRSSQTRKTVLVQLHSGSDEMEPADHPYEGLALRGWNHHARRSLMNR